MKGKLNGAANDDHSIKSHGQLIRPCLNYSVVFL